MDPPSGFLNRTPIRGFRDRYDAGRALAERLVSYRGTPGLLVLGLPRGGIPVGWEVASALHAELDVFLVRKLGVPQLPELAMGALASGGGVVMNTNVVSSLRITPEQLRAVVAAERAELNRRERAYREGRQVADPFGRVVILVDDGIATGASMLAAVRAVRTTKPRSVVVAVPVGPAAACGELARDVDDFVCVITPDVFDAVGQVYGDFHQVSDDEVRRLLSATTS
ncbi:Putative phosphoribosyl transferasec/MT0597 [Mycobacterium basiliense]|uniref:Phosphoribosyl transferasec/MT0597 n=1 Tax=Mycobacterium basiliense TaxID=2094119 RepID=A0A3S4CCT6_9MYCO|nr:phosphoribosyltransferase [Mycobacterium basiliense]VDM89323.1 Putative phosphoribosyl transferasec/MT0597 [Mycobacterium basiliense]